MTTRFLQKLIIVFLASGSHYEYRVEGFWIQGWINEIGASVGCIRSSIPAISLSNFCYLTLSFKTCSYTGKESFWLQNGWKKRSLKYHVDAQTHGNSGCSQRLSSSPEQNIVYGPNTKFALLFCGLEVPGNGPISYNGLCFVAFTFGCLEL